MKLLDLEPIGTTNAMGSGPGGAVIVPVKQYAETIEGRVLRDKRLKYGVSLGDMARHLGISVADLSAVERGAKRPENWVMFMVEVCRRIAPDTPPKGTP